MSVEIIPYPFLRVWARYIVSVEGGAYVGWEMTEEFDDPRPHTYQLQGAIRTPVTGVFENIGLPVDDPYYLSDPGAEERRSFAAEAEYVYRIQLTTSRRTYVSKPIGAPDILGFRSWRLARDMQRKEKLRFDRYTGLRGWLLKRIRKGNACPRCSDPVTKDSVDTACTVCWGTKFEAGYHSPIRAFMDLEINQVREETDPQSVTATAKTMQAPNCRLLGDPTPNELDVFVDSRGDRRYSLRDVANVAMIQGYPVVTSAVAYLIPASDVIYDYVTPIDDRQPL